MDPHYEEELSEDGKTFTLKFNAPKQLLLHPEYSAMVHDEVLRRAHARGIIPVGEVFHTEEDAGGTALEQAPLVEGESIVTQRLRAMGIRSLSERAFLPPPPPDIMRVTAQVVVGSLLDSPAMADPVGDAPEQTTEMSLQDLLNQGIPDDISELDGL